MLVCRLALVAQPIFPANGELFGTNEIPRVDITIHPDTLAWIYQNVESDIEHQAIFSFTTSNGTDTISPIGFRLRGNTSRYSAKKSYKISFNTFVKGQKFKGVEKLNLNGEHNDPSIIRSFITWHFFKQMQVPSSRCNYVNLYINQTYAGIYMNVEHVDEEFVQKRFEHNQGNLYKCLYGANLTYRGANSDNYKNNGYTLQNNPETDDFSDLITLTQTLQNTESANLPQMLEPIFNVNGFIRYLAVETFAGHWDAYSCNMNNFYLYQNKITGKMEFMPYDVDNTLGIDWFGIDWGTRNIYQWWNHDLEVPMTQKIMANPLYKDRYSFFLNQLLTQFADTTQLFPKIDSVKNNIAPWAKIDPARPLDYGWTYNNFLKSYTQILGGHVKYGIKNYLKTRHNTIKQQLQLNAIAPIIENVYHNFPLPAQPIIIKANLTDDEPNPTATLFISFNDADFTAIPFMWQQSNTYHATVQGIAGNAQVRYYIEATDASMQKTREPYSGYYTLTIKNSDKTIYLNEIMAANTGVVFDNYGQAEDWIELYNNGSTAVNLGNLYLTDDVNNRAKWRLPQVTLNAGEYYLIWADNDTQQGEHHANFKLGKSGEIIGLYDAFETGYALIDTLRFGQQTDNLSIGRMADGRIIPQDPITPMGLNGDANVAFVNFTYNMSQPIATAGFNIETDFIDLPGTFNNWAPKVKYVDNNADSLIRFTVFGLTKGETIEYKARINASWNTCEFNDLGGDGNRQLTLGVSNLSVYHWYNQQEVGLPKQNTATAKLFPNPVNAGQPLYIEAETPIQNVSVYNYLGKLILTQPLNGSTNGILPTQTLGQGIYLVQINFGHRHAVTYRAVVY